MPGTFTIDGTARNIDEMRELAGSEVGVSDWHTLTQREIDLFAEATGDFEWLHVDPVRAADGPFGSTIAHGLLTLSLAPRFITQVLSFDGFRNGLNYGSNKVRFVTPVPVGSRLRGRVSLLDAGGDAASCQLILGVTMELEGVPKPACVAEFMFRYFE